MATQQGSGVTPCERAPGHTPGGGHPVCGAGTRDSGSRAAAYRPVGPAPLSPACLLAPPGRLCLPRSPPPPRPRTHQFPRRVRPAVYFLLKYPGRCHQEAPQRQERGGGENVPQPRKMNGRLPLFLLLSDFLRSLLLGWQGPGHRPAPAAHSPAGGSPKALSLPGSPPPASSTPKGTTHLVENCSRFFSSFFFFF